jgi:membrane protease YdiL (CAAX protease family)
VHSKDTKAIVAFVAIAYGLSIALSLLIDLSGGHNSTLIGLSYISMALPAIAVLIVHLAMSEPPRVNWDRLPRAYLPAALFLMPIVMHASMLPLMATAGGGVHWQAPRGWGALSPAGLVARIVLNAIFGVAVVSFLAFFEEIGWRAWLLPRLVDRTEARRAVVITSVIWALWHVPFQLSGIQYIAGVSPLKLALVQPLGTAAAGLVLGWLWLRTDSIWLVTIAHGSLNAWGQYAFKYMKDSGSPATDIAVLGAGSLALLMVGGFLLSRCGPRRHLM